MNRNQLLSLLLFLFLPFVATACGGSSNSDSDDAVDGLTLNPTTLEFNGAGDTATVAVQATRGGWSAYTTASWLTVTSAGGSTAQGTLTVTAEKLDGGERTATIQVRLGTKTQNITVTQQQSAAEDEPEDETVTTPAGYTLVWHDEFGSGDQLGSDWTHEVQGAGWVNNELQAYINSSKVTSIDHGKLRITCYQASDGKIYSGRVYAKPQTGWKYGYFEARIRLPKGKGTWPAFWMMPADNDFTANPWPHCGEIDIMEEVGFNPSQVLATIHCSKYNNSGTTIEQGSTTSSTLQTDYHVYACEWTADHLEFFVDGRCILKYVNDGTGKDQWPFDVPFYPILNLAFGGNWGGQQGVDYTCLPATMSVDYVRVFQKK